MITLGSVICHTPFGEPVIPVFSTFGWDVRGHTYQETACSTNPVEVQEAFPHFKLKLDPEEIENLSLF